MQRPKRQKVKDETPDGATLGSENDVQRALFQHEIAGIAREGRRGALGEKALGKLLAAVNAALQQQTELEVEMTEEGRAYAATLGVEAETSAFAFAPPTLSLLCRSECRTRLDGSRLCLKLPFPEQVLEEKDYLNHRYTLKKILVLQAIHYRLRRCPSVLGSWLGSYREEVRSPCLYVDWRLATGNEGFVLLPVLVEGTLPYRRFLLEQNNLRGYLDSKGQLRPTPCTNMAVLRDMTLSVNAHFVDTTIATLPAAAAFFEALTLLKVWCRCHWLETIDGFDELTWWVLILRGIRHGQISCEASSSLSILCSMLSLMKSPKLSKLMGTSEERWDFSVDPHRLVRSDKRLTAEGFKKLEMPWMIDVTGGYNLIWDVSHAWMSSLKTTADRMLAVLTTEDMTRGTERARSLLTGRPPLLAQFDTVFTISVQSGGRPEAWDTSPFRTFAARAERIVREGLTDRCEAVRFLTGRDAQVQSPGALDPSGFSLFLCIYHRRENSWRLTDKGPSPEDKAAARAFRAFWGNKAQLKKFQDGTICEAVTWETGQGHRHEIIDRIVQYVLQRHLSIQAESQTLQISGLVGTCFESLDRQAELTAALTEAKQAVSNLLKDLPELALNVVSVQEIGAAARKTACFAVSHHPLADADGPSPDGAVPRCVEPVRLLLSLEASGSWPVDPKAFEKTKTAMYAQLSLALQKKGHFAKASRAFVDLYFAGFVFRLLFMTERERKEGSLLLVEHQYHSFIKKAVDRHPALPLTVKLLKRWASSHLFDYHLDEHILELLAVHQYEQQSARHPMNSPLRGFFSVLHLVAEFPWSTVPLVLDCENELSENDVRSIHSWYSEIRAEDPSSRSMAICLPFDRQSSLTRTHPQRPVLYRLKRLAQKCSAASKQPLSSLFAETEWQAFDAVLHLNRDALAHPDRALRPEQTLTESSTGAGKCGGVVLSCIPKTLMRKFSKKQLCNQLLVGFNPLQRVWQELEASLGEVALFCCNDHGGQKIGVRWKAEAFRPRAEPDIARFSHWTEVNGSFIPDVTAVLCEMSSLGKGLIDRVEIL